MAKREMPKVTITSDGTKTGTTVQAGDVDITHCVVGISWSAGARGYDGPPEARLTMRVDRLELKETAAHYLGLEQIPDELLRAELARRHDR